ncbi:hypothetical protein [Chryseobacterium indologenes]|uniref:DUF4303 domain-containing protein n=1 Tax=Chryseobacterium indologenes TaxID=253 RepID=A0A0N0ZWJ3_CHRID|nr:hypothetical protein [Chryseobacterium indologenes]KPE52830.1 hypothetical protein AOB46_02200 [Chryseobacterium indologenes]
MEQIEELKKSNGILKSALNGIREKITGELVNVLNGNAISMLPDFKKEDIAAHNFEYRHEWFSMVFFGSNSAGLTITEKIDFLRNELNAYFSESEELMDIVSDLEDDCEDEEEWEEMREEYEQEKYEIFDDWFESCWIEAQKLTGCSVPTYLSIDELDFGVEFISSDSVEINKNQTNIRRYIH